MSVHKDVVSTLSDMAAVADNLGFGNAAGLIRRAVRDLGAIDPEQFNACVPQDEAEADVANETDTAEPAAE